MWSVIWNRFGFEQIERRVFQSTGFTLSLFLKVLNILEYIVLRNIYNWQI
jgi:hypothetical protein